jgi:hypothetical protein
MRTGTVTVAAGALALVAAGCGQKCSDQTPPLKAAPSCEVLASAPVTVPLAVCPRCDQGSPRCLVHLEQASQGQITLEPVSEVCDPSSSCPTVDPTSCPATPLACSFTAPAAPASYQLIVATPSGVEERTLTVIASGTPAGCSP